MEQSKPSDEKQESRLILQAALEGLNQRRASILRPIQLQLDEIDRAMARTTRSLADLGVAVGSPVVNQRGRKARTADAKMSDATPPTNGRRKKREVTPEQRENLRIKALARWAKKRAAKQAAQMPVVPVEAGQGGMPTDQPQHDITHESTPVEQPQAEFTEA